MGRCPKPHLRDFLKKSLLKISKNFPPRAGFRNESRPWGKFLKVLRKLLLRSFLSRVRDRVPRSSYLFTVKMRHPMPSWETVQEVKAAGRVTEASPVRRMR